MRFEHGDERYTKYLEGGLNKGLGIQVVRRLMGMTQKELAEQIGVTPAAISSWENGLSSCSPERLQQISEILGVSPAHLQNPSIDEVERASHVAVYKGRKVQRMVLEVNHERLGDYPTPWVEPHKLGLIPKWKREPVTYVYLDHVPTKEEQHKGIRYAYGPGNIIGTNSKGTSPFFRRMPTKEELKSIVLENYLDFGSALQAFTRMKHIDTKILAERTGIAQYLIPIYMNLRADTLEENEDEWRNIRRFEIALKIPKFYLLAFTRQGRELLITDFELFGD